MTYPKYKKKIHLMIYLKTLVNRVIRADSRTGPELLMTISLIQKLGMKSSNNRMLSDTDSADIRHIPLYNLKIFCIY